MKNIAVLCVRRDTFKDFVLKNVAIDIDSLVILPQKILFGNWAYWHISKPVYLRGVLWSYYVLVGPQNMDLVACDYDLVGLGAELLPTWRVDYGNRESLEDFSG